MDYQDRDLWKKRVNIPFQCQLKRIKTYDDFEKFLKDCKENNIEMRSKKTHRRCFDFELNISSNKIFYRVDDAKKSTGLCRIENLHVFLYADDNKSDIQIDAYNNPQIFIKKSKTKAVVQTQINPVNSPQIFIENGKKVNIKIDEKNEDDTIN